MYVLTGYCTINDIGFYFRKLAFFSKSEELTAHNVGLFFYNQIVHVHLWIWGLLGWPS